MPVTKEEIKKLARRCGFDDCGISSVEPFEDYESQLRARASADIDAAGRYLQMIPRARPADRMPWARAIIVCIRHYNKYRLPQELLGHIGRNYLCDSRRKGCPDYSIDVKFEDGLRDLEIRFKKGSVPDRSAAVRAGIVQIGRNNFAYSKKGGSWLNIETWVVDSELEPDTPTVECPCPPECSACQKACPTSALHAPFSMRMSRCICYLSYSAPEPIDAELWNRMGEWVYGCDVCQQVCPMNRGKWEEREGMPWIEKFRDKLTPEALKDMDYDTYRNIVHPRFWYIKLDNIRRWHRNAQRAYDNMQKREGK